MPHNVASDLGLHCWLTGFSITNRIKATIRPDTPKMTNGLIQHITVEESISIQWVKYDFPYFSIKNLRYDLSLELCHYDGSNKGHNTGFCLEMK